MDFWLDGVLSLVNREPPITWFKQERSRGCSAKSPVGLTPSHGPFPGRPRRGGQDVYFTERQLKILNYLRGYILDRGMSPTLEEIAGNFGISRVTAHEHIRALEKKGALHKVPNHARSIELADDPRSQPKTGPSLPVMGAIAAGTPIEAVEDRQELSFDNWLPGEDCYALKVRGDSMIEDGIFDGDYVIVERRQTARNGEVVVALLEANEATLKRYYNEGSYVRLQPANSSMDPILVNNVTIQGVVVGLLRRFH
jgi:repressor LexA